MRNYIAIDFTIIGKYQRPQHFLYFLPLLQENVHRFISKSHSGSNYLFMDLISIGIVQEVIFLDIAFPTLILVENIVSVF